MSAFTGEKQEDQEFKAWAMVSKQKQKNRTEQILSVSFIVESSVPRRNPGTRKMPTSKLVNLVK